jgi:hypothetical protein
VRPVLRWTLLAGGNPVSWTASPLRLGLAARLVCAGATATILWLAVLWAIS